ncbi:ABC transporter permease [Larkinella terrae]|uniref:FtsX-like permease family protein n=1 Tax=Larkinella terrae TaxID=2025311 RepID=A0A7K0ER04_9BACT|nr:ABC transporter permease [Larkinella terrae]MRS64243.1 FtsX-like permease family protein [Larkinella terrae]
MLQNYLKIAWRSLRKNRGFSFINILGLAVGMAVAMLIGFWVWDELTFDRFYKNEANLYRVMLNRTANGETTTQPNGPLPLGDALRNEIPEIRRITESLNTNMRAEAGLKAGDKKLMRKGQNVGSEFFGMFDLPMLYGNPTTALKDLNSIILTEQTAEALFGKTDPLGKTVRLNDAFDLNVTAVLKKLPGNTAWDFDFIVPFSHLEANTPWMQSSRTNWNNNIIEYLVELHPNADRAAVDSRLKGILKRHNPESIFEAFLHPVERWHLYGEFENGKNTGGFIRYVRLFAMVGLAVLLIACINFMNLATARSEKRAKEVGVRKAVGSFRSQLIAQFLSESMLIAGLALVLALALVLVFLPVFNEFTQKQLRFPWLQTGFWLLALGFTIITGALAGSYPAFYLSSFNAVRVLKGSNRAGRNANWPRKVLVVAQFTGCIAFIISAILVYQQIQYAKNRPMGYNPDRLLTVALTNDLNRNYDAVRNELLRSGAVENVTKASSPATTITGDTRVDWSGKAPDEIMRLNLIGASPNYLQTMGIKLKSGRNFYPNNSDSSAVILNEAAVRAMRLKEPLNQEMTMVWNPGRKLHVIGVVENSIIESPYTPVHPLMLLPSQPFESYLIFRLAKHLNTAEALARIEPVFQKLNPAYPFDYQFVNDDYNRKFRQEELVGKLAGVFAVLAIFIACLGLFGLAASLAEQRTKEVGIRKVLGASVVSLWGLLSREFVGLVLIACLLASPVAAYVLNNWLNQFDYRISLPLWVFALSGGLAILIALLTVSFQSIKAALMNPVKSLRSE